MGRRLYSWKPAKRASGHLTSPAIATPHPPGPSYPFLSSPPENGFQPIQDFKKRGDMGGSRGHTDCDKAQTDVIGVLNSSIKAEYYYIYWKLCSFCIWDIIQEVLFRHSLVYRYGTYLLFGSFSAMLFGSDSVRIPIISILYSDPIPPGSKLLSCYSDQTVGFVQKIVVKKVTNIISLWGFKTGVLENECFFEVW